MIFFGEYLGWFDFVFDRLNACEYVRYFKDILSLVSQVVIIVVRSSFLSLYPRKKRDN